MQLVPLRELVGHDLAGIHQFYPSGRSIALVDGILQLNCLPYLALVVVQRSSSDIGMRSV
jgi:hypothetical protein